MAQTFSMRRGDRSHRHHVARRSIRRVLILSRKLVNIIHPSCLPALVTQRNGQRFSLISCADYQATVTRTSQRDSASSNQIFGFHVVCGECDGFVVSNGILRSCKHQRDSGSILSENFGKTGREGTDVSVAQANDALVINVQPPTPVSSPELDIGAESLSREMRLRGNNVAGAGFSSDERSIDGRNFSAQKYNANQLDPESDTLMQDWTRWSERWEAGLHYKKDTLLGTRVPMDDGTIDRPHCDSETLMQDWREWCEGWERSVKSR